MGTLQDWIKRHTEDYGQLVTNERQQQKIGGYANAVGRGLKQSFPMLEKQPQDVSIADMLSSGLGVMPATFIGPKAATWSAEKAAKAAKLLDEGVDPAKVWKEQLIGRMPDGKLFSEIDDSLSNYVAPKKHGSYLGDVLQDSKAYSEYPKLGYINTKEGSSSFFDNATKNNISIKETAKNKKSVALHEMQHAIQQIEDWSKGGDTNHITEDMFAPNFVKKLNEYRSVIGLNPHAEQSIKNIIMDAKRDGYYRLTGEAQARATQDRLNMSLDERRNNYPLAGGKLSDIPLEQLIYKYGDNGTSMAIDQSLLSDKRKLKDIK